MLVIWTFSALLAMFKPYPSISDVALHVSLLPLIWHQVRGNKYNFALVICTVCLIVLMPILMFMWLDQVEVVLVL